jgi:hypothetical protein
MGGYTASEPFYGEGYLPHPASPAGGPPTNSQGGATAGLLTAKTFNDNENFDFWLNLVKPDGVFRSFAERWSLNMTNRVTVIVTNGPNAVCGAKVVLLDQQGGRLWEAVTDNKGRAYLFFNVSRNGEIPSKVTVSKDGANAEAAVERDVADQSLTVELAANSNPKSLDLMFMIDTTGSMGDELSYLQTELDDIIRRVKREQGDTPLRLSVNFYRDFGDEYVVRPFPFTTDIETAIADLKAQDACGGGDYEEAVHEALKNAIHEHEWNDMAYAKLLFLVLDAPPHDYTAEDMRRYMRDAAARGIRIIPVVCSGSDQNNEFLMRALDIATGGTYVTLTSDSGIGEPHLEPTIGEAEVFKLNDLLVKIIGDYMK